MAKVSQRRIAYHRKIWRGRCRVADPDQVFLHGSESGSSFQISLDPYPDPVFKFLWTDLDPVSAQILENCRKVSKSDLSEENLKFMTKDRQKMKKATISY